jgi:hypothetical protein
MFNLKQWRRKRKLLGELEAANREWYPALRAAEESKDLDRIMKAQAAPPATSLIGSRVTSSYGAPVVAAFESLMSRCIGPGDSRVWIG